MIPEICRQVINRVAEGILATPIVLFALISTHFGANKNSTVGRNLDTFHVATPANATGLPAANHEAIVHSRATPRGNKVRIVTPAHNLLWHISWFPASRATIPLCVFWKLL